MEVSRFSTTCIETLNTSYNEFHTWENTSETPELTQEQSSVMLTEDVEGDIRNGMETWLQKVSLFINRRRCL